jgi:hypothetical protein
MHFRTKTDSLPLGTGLNDQMSMSFLLNDKRFNECPDVNRLGYKILILLMTFTTLGLLAYLVMSHLLRHYIEPIQVLSMCGFVALSTCLWSWLRVRPNHFYAVALGYVMTCVSMIFIYFSLN